MHSSLPWFVASPDPEVYLGNNYVVLDFETTNHEKGSALDERNALVLARWRLGSGHPSAGRVRAYGERADEFGQHRLADHIKRAKFIVAHNTKFELGWLKRCGVDLRTVLPYDTMIGEKVLAGNRRRELSLEATASRRGLGHKKSFVSALIAAGVCPSEIPAAALDDYCRQDVDLTEQVFLAQRVELANLALLPVAYVRNLTTPALADIEPNGMFLAKDRVAATYAEYAQQYGELEEKFATLTGGINVKSPKQMAEFIYGTPTKAPEGAPPGWRSPLGFEELTDYKGKALKTDTGNPRTDKETLAKLKAHTPEQKAFLRVAKELVKLKTPLQNLTKMWSIVNEHPDDPRVFAVYNQTITQTDRLSSTARNGGFQFHNFDRAFKKLFRARKDGRVVCEADAPQLEFRVATLLGHDAVAKDDIQKGVDVHANTASVIGVDRQQAKPFTFKPLYGGNSGTPRQRAYYEWFRNRYAGIYRTQESWTYDVARDKHLVTPWGLRFYWPDAEVSKTGYVTNTTQIFNYPIQSFATADIIPLCLVLVWHRVGSLDADDCLLVNTIHDSVIAEVEPATLPAYKDIVVESFTKDIYELVESIYGIAIDVPLGVGIKAGEYWGEGKEEKFEPAK
jgi:DNA polymerase I-like protein with 3'-5' exonuclease and polymerase domains